MKLKEFIFKNKWNILIFLIPFIIFLIFLIIYFPGIYNYDVFTQLRQIKDGIYNSAHPFTHTFYLSIFHKYIKFKLGVPLFQIVWISYLWMTICKYNRTKDSKIVILFQVLITLFMSLNPLIITSIISNNKDTLFFLVFFTICYQLQKLFDQKFNISNLNYIYLAFLFVLFKNIRHNGYYCIIIFLIILFIFMIKYLYKTNKKSIFVFAVSLVVFSSVFNIFNNLFKVEKHDITATGFLPLKAMQLDGYLYNKNELNSREIKSLSKYVDIDSLAQNTANCTFSDNVALVKKTKYFDRNQKRFVKDSINIAFNHKLSTLKFYFHSSTIVWDLIVRPGSVTNYLWLWNDMPNKLPGYDFKYKDTELFEFINTKITNSISNNYVKVLLYSPGSYMYLSILLTCFLIYLKKYKYILITIFNFINIAIISLSIPVQDTRYLINNFALVYILLIIITNELYKKRFIK